MITADDDNLFKDVLQTVIAIAAIAIGATGLGVYKLLAQQIEETVNRHVGKNLQIATAVHKIDLGYVYWNFFLRSTNEDDQSRYIGDAIIETKMAYTYLQKLNETDLDVEPHVIQVRNNLAYFIYEKYRQPNPRYTETEQYEERQLALIYIEYLDERRGRYPDLIAIQDIDDTVTTVRDFFN